MGLYWDSVKSQHWDNEINPKVQMFGNLLGILYGI